MTAARQIHRFLWVGPLQARRDAEGRYALIIDCIGAETGPWDGDAEVLVLKPTGRTSHTWGPELDTIVEAAINAIRQEARTLITCRSGRSRSVTASAAILLALGAATTPEEAVGRCRAAKGRRPCGTSYDSLRRWFEIRGADRDSVQRDLFPR